MEEVKNENKTLKKKSKTRMILVILFIIVFALFNYISLRGNFLEYKELGEEYINIFKTNLEYKYNIMGVSFILLYIIMYFTNRGIKKGLKDFFEQEKKEMPKLLNKSISLVVAAIGSVIVSNVLLNKIILFANNTSFEISDPIFNMDISYYMFIKPVIEIFILCLIILIVGLTIYMALYYIIVFNMHFDGIDRKTLKESKLMKKAIRNLKLVTVAIALLTLINTQNIVLQKFLSLEDEIELIGAGFTEATIKLWGYRIFSVLIVVAIFMAIKYFKSSDTKKVLISLATLPAYLVCLFIVMVTFDLIFVNSNELDKEKKYIAYNIENTKNAYGINIQEENLDYSGTITVDETEDNQEVLDNITIISKDAVLKTLEDSQTNTGYYTYRNATIGKYSIDGKDKLVYVSPREIVSGADRTYNNKTYEYTHGYGQVITLATNSTELGSIEYIQKGVTNNKIKTTQPRIYFGLKTDDTIVTNTKNKSEYDYTDDNGTDHEYTYTGKAGLNLDFMDRIVLALKQGNINLAFSSSITNESKILINRNIRDRTKKALPYLLYDENPYTVVDDNGNIIWVLDAYTVSSNYPYSSYSNIIYEGSKQKINYIRNSVKVLINSYDGTMKFYITDRTDPIAMAYRNTYKTLFEDIDSKIPEDISRNFIYPEYLYNIQANMLTLYHNVKTDVLYRSDDIWELAKYNTTQTTKSTGTILLPYYTMVKTIDSDKEVLGLVQAFTPNEKQNIISYLVGSYNDGNSKLKLYKFPSDSNILGPMQLDTQIMQDETISKELETLNITGTKITKQMIIVPIKNTLLYVEPIYQTMINESDVPILKKIIVASGNKVAIGNNLDEALKNLLSQDAVDIEVENTDDIEGLIEAIIKANNNLTQSNKNNDWEMMGSDLQKLQTLINSLEDLKEKEQEENNTTNNQTNTISNNTIDENDVNENYYE